MEMNINKYEAELIQDWISQMHTQKWKYSEPFLDRSTTELIRSICTSLKQDIHIFVNAVEILEEYIKRKDYRGEKIKDPALTTFAVVLISSKHVGEQDMKIKYIEVVLRNFTGTNYTLKALKLQEMEILSVLDGNLPIQSVVEDLNTCVAKFEKDCKIKATILPVCTDVLEMMYITRKEWFFELKALYAISNEAFEVLEQLICSRFYLPMGILNYAMKYSGYSHSLNTQGILEDSANWSEIHIDHLETLILKIREIFLRE